MSYAEEGGLHRMVSQEEVAEFIEKVEDDIGPALIRTEVTVAQLERRLSFLTERVRVLEEEMVQYKMENAELKASIKKLQEKK